MPLSLQTSIKSQLSQGKWEKVAKWLYWTLIEAVVGCLSRALSFHFLSSGLKLIGMNFFKTREQTHQRACRISSGFLSVELLMSHWIWTTKPHRNRKTNIALIIHTLSNGTSSMKTSPPAESAFVNLSFGLPYGNNYSLYYIVVIVFSLFKILCLYLPKYIKRNKNSPTTSNVSLDRFSSKLSYVMPIFTNIHKYIHPDSLQNGIILYTLIFKLFLKGYIDVQSISWWTYSLFSIFHWNGYFNIFVHIS